MRGNMSPVRPFTLDLVPGASLYGHISRRWGLCRFRAWEGRCAETCLQWHSLVCPVSVDAGTGVPTPRTWAWSRGWGTAGRLGAGLPNPRGTRRNPPEAGSSHGRPDVTRPGPATPEGDECGETWDEARAASTTRPCTVRQPTRRPWTRAARASCQGSRHLSVGLPWPPQRRVGLRRRRDVGQASGRNAGVRRRSPPRWPR